MNKSPILQNLSALVNGINQLKTYNYMDNIRNIMNYSINRSIRASYSYLFVGRIYGVYNTYLGLFLLIAGIYIGI